MNEATLGDGSKVKVGDIVYFKCDVEQYGMLAKIEPSGYNRNHIKLTLTNKHGFVGGYIGGETTTRESAVDCWSN
jgi:hypothetical protein